MPFPFSLPTTSHLSFQAHYSSSTHPSLPATATSYRSVLRAALKKHKRLPSASQPGNLPTIVSAINDYLPYLLALDAGLSGRQTSGEDIDIVLKSEVIVEWRPMIASSQVPTRDAARIKGLGLDFEIAFAIQTFATVQVLLAREQLLTLYAEDLPSPERRLAAVQNATKHLIIAESLHTYIVQRYNGTSDALNIPAAAVDINEAVQAALSSLSLAETTILFVLKDDPYPALTIQSRSKTDKEWMIKAPDIPKVRAHLFARLSLAASDHAGKAAAGLSSTGTKVSSDLVRYAEDLRRVARAKACRFFGLDADLSGNTGEGIAWLRAGMNELGITGSVASGGPSFSKLKSTIQSHRASPHLLKPGSSNPSWGLDAGKLEESLTISMLEKKWVKINDTMNVQLIPESAPLAASMPSGRDIYKANAWKPVPLAAEELAKMRAPIHNDDGLQRRLGELGIGDSSDEEGADEMTRQTGPVGAFPGTHTHYSRNNRGDEAYF
ncbi:putative ph-response regulator protein palc [Phaeomoniella chlamydospora]|uniref:pH-response regulator protein palC n=1 Tax=Phaeomoniella chlamydospora TaxID=158046 RepID=A0A0G2E153_PHACM|nr:putative ph-response regulator protein palc [Phaeomoniella chlamydospora]